MGQDETWHRGRPRPRPHCVRWGPSSHSQNGNSLPPIFGLCLLCQTASWIKMPLGTEVGLGPGDIVLGGDPAPPKRGHRIPHFSAHVDGWVDQDTSWYGGRRLPRQRCITWEPSSCSGKGHSSSSPALFGQLWSGTVVHINCSWALVQELSSS